MIRYFVTYIVLCLCTTDLSFSKARAATPTYDSLSEHTTGTNGYTAFLSESDTDSVVTESQDSTDLYISSTTSVSSTGPDKLSTTEEGVPISSTVTNSATPTPTGECVHDTCSSCSNTLNCGWCVEEERCTVREVCRSGTWLNQGEMDTAFINTCDVIDYLGNYTVEFEPQVGFLEGGTGLVVTVYTEKTVSFKAESVTVAGLPCDNAVVTTTSQTSHQVQCTTTPSTATREGLINIDILINLKNVVSLQSSTRFSYIDPQIEDFRPRLGPRSGGTSLTIQGQYLDIDHNVTVEVGGLSCQRIRVIDSYITCLTPSVPIPTFASINITFYDTYSRISPWYFTYEKDPTIKTISPLKTFMSGGIAQRVTGTNFNVIAQPIFVVSVKTNSTTTNFHSLCIDITATEMTCPSPELTFDVGTATESPDNIRRKRSEHSIDGCSMLSTDTTTGAEVSLHVGFIMDGVAEFLPENIIRFLPPEFTEIRVYEDPVVYNFSHAMYDSIDGDDVYIYNPWKSKYLVLKGTMLDCGASKEDYIVQIGTDFCRVISLYTTELTCEPPKTKPPVRSKYRKEHGHPQVVVQVGRFQDTGQLIGYLRYIDKNESIETWMIVLAVALILLLIIVLVIVIVKLYRCRNKSKKMKEKVAESINVDHIYQSYLISDTWKKDPLSYFDKNTRQDVKHVMIDRKKLQMHEKEILGEGFKGKVVRGVLYQHKGGRRSPREVAVKMLKGEMELDDFRTFVIEGLMMKDFDHPHVLPLLGVCVRKGGVPLIILPYMKNGDLKSFIANPEREFAIKDLLTYSLHVAEGMAYLAENNFVHRDLAARNCMVDELEIVKISDFGLSRDLHEKDYYTSMDKSIKLPVKWMAPESFQRRVFTTKTDVWSFGVLLWEVITRGETPYGYVSHWDMLRYLSSGKRLHQPQYASDDLYGIMLQCWNTDPNDRPEFKTLAAELKQLLHLPNKHKPFDHITYSPYSYVVPDSVQYLSQPTDPADNAQYSSQPKDPSTHSYLELDSDQFSSHTYQNSHWQLHGK